MDFKAIIFDQQDHIAKITLNRPEKKNALSRDMQMELMQVLGAIREDESAKVVILTGAGDAFCSGGDIDTFGEMTTVNTRKRLQRSKNLVESIVDLEKPVIAAINGFAVGAGMNIALACDILIASEAAKFGEVFVRIGAIPDLGGHYFLPLRVGVAKAKELMFTGDIIDAQEALSIGVVNRVVPHEKLEETTLAFAARLARGPSQSYAMIKTALNHWPASLKTFLGMESNMQAVAFSSADFDEGRRAFLEKRQPVFSGK